MWITELRTTNKTHPTIPITFDIYIEKSHAQQSEELIEFVWKWGGMVGGVEAYQGYINLIGYANRDLLLTLHKKCEENGYFFNEIPPQ